MDSQKDLSQDEQIQETGQLELTSSPEKHHIHLLTIIGEIEGHENLPGSSKTTKYEHLLPRLATISPISVGMIPMTV